MSLNPQILSLLQTAGQSLYDADQALQAAVNEHADRVRTSIAANPFDARSDAQFEEWKTIARLSKAVAQIEDELKKVYGVANAWTSLATLPRNKVSALGLPVFPAAPALATLQTVDATDVVDKRQRRSQVQAMVKDKPRVEKPKSPVRALRGNTAKLLAALMTRLNDKSHAKVNRSSLALEIGLPKGSIGASFIKLMELGYLDEDGQGGLRLAGKPKS